LERESPRRGRLDLAGQDQRGIELVVAAEAKVADAVGARYEPGDRGRAGALAAGDEDRPRERPEPREQRPIRPLDHPDELFPRADFRSAPYDLALLHRCPVGLPCRPCPAVLLRKTGQLAPGRCAGLRRRRDPRACRILAASPEGIAGRDQCTKPNARRSFVSRPGKSAEISSRCSGASAPKRTYKPRNTAQSPAPSASSASGGASSSFTSAAAPTNGSHAISVTRRKRPASFHTAVSRTNHQMNRFFISTALPDASIAPAIPRIGISTRRPAML